MSGAAVYGGLKFAAGTLHVCGWSTAMVALHQPCAALGSDLPLRLEGCTRLHWPGPGMIRVRTPRTTFLSHPPLPFYFSSPFSPTPHPKIFRQLQAMSAAHWQALRTCDQHISWELQSEEEPILLPGLLAVMATGSQSLAFDPGLQEVFARAWRTLKQASEAGVWAVCCLGGACAVQGHRAIAGCASNGWCTTGQAGMCLTFPF